MGVCRPALKSSGFQQCVGVAFMEEFTVIGIIVGFMRDLFFFVL
jgi:hypothetical protein